jgi:hypothetical protein
MNFFEQRQDKIISLLLSLGQTKEEVAYNLHKQEIVGLRNNCRYCPIANYLSKNFIYVNSSEKGISISDKDNGYISIDDLYFNLLHCPELKGVFEFIKDFDRGKFKKMRDTKLENWLSLSQPKQTFFSKIKSFLHL